jgi:hypothetical protein
MKIKTQPFNNLDYTKKQIVKAIKENKEKRKTRYSIDNEETYLPGSEVIKLIEKTNPPFKIMVGTLIKYTHEDFVSGSLVAEQIINNIDIDSYDEQLVYIDKYCDQFYNNEITEGLKKVIVDFLNENAEQPQFTEIRRDNILNIV